MKRAGTKPARASTKTEKVGLYQHGPRAGTKNEKNRVRIHP